MVKWEIAQKAMSCMEICFIFFLHCLQCSARGDLGFLHFTFDLQNKAGEFRSLLIIFHTLKGITLIIKSPSSLIVVPHSSRPCGESVSAVHLKSASDYFLSIHHFVVWPQGINKQLSWIQVMANQSAFTTQSL